MRLVGCVFFEIIADRGSAEEQVRNLLGVVAGQRVRKGLESCPRQHSGWRWLTAISQAWRPEGRSEVSLNGLIDALVNRALNPDAGAVSQAGGR